MRDDRSGRRNGPRDGAATYATKAEVQALEQRVEALEANLKSAIESMSQLAQALGTLLEKLVVTRSDEGGPGPS